MMDYADIVARPRVRIRPAAAESDPPRLIADPPSELPHKKRPANRTSFQPGKSGNPKGRPRGAKGVKAITRKVLTEKVEVQPGKRMELFEALLRQEAQCAAKGDWRARATMFSLSRWVLGSEADAGSVAVAASAPEMTDTGRAILEMFAEEIREEERTKNGQPPSEPPS